MLVYRFDEFELDVSRCTLSHNGTSVSLEPQVYSLLEYLVKNAGKTVSREEIVTIIWNGRHVSHNAVDNRIRTVRAAIGDNGKDQRLIKTFPNMGYKFIGTVSTVSTPPDHDNRLEDKGDPASSSTSTTVSSTDTVSSTEQPNDNIIASQAQPADNTDPAALEIKGSGTWNFSKDIPIVAVLPFDNMSNDPEQDHLADGICEDILTMLSKINSLDVIARNSSFAYKGQAADIREVGKKLGATHILEGSVRKSGSRLRITGQLIEAKTGTHLWADRYDCLTEDIFDIQDDMTRQIVTALEANLLQGDTTRYWGGTTKIFKAWELQNQSMPLLVRNDNRKNILKSRALSEAALEIDPTYAEAWGSVAASYLFEVIGCWTANPVKKLQLADEAYNKAFELSPENPMLGSVKGYMAIYLDNHDYGLSLIEKAAKTDPDNLQFKIQKRYARIYRGDYNTDKRAEYQIPHFVYRFLPSAAIQIHLARGEMQAACTLAEKHICDTPDYPQTYLLAAIAQTNLGLFNTAQMSMRKLLDFNPNFSPEHLSHILPFKDKTIIANFVQALQSIDREI